MASTLRRRIPWSSAEGAGENIPLINSTSSSVVEGAEGIELAEFGTFASVEEASLALDASGVGAPLGVTVGILAAIGFGVYEIYEHLVSKNPKILQSRVQRLYNSAKANPAKHIENAKNFVASHKALTQDPTELDIIPLENQSPTEDFVSLENQHQLTLPFTKYTGPGNPLNSGEPANRADQESQIHDFAYNSAKDKYDIFKADEKYIEHQSNIFAEGLSGKASVGELITAGVGLSGIGAKHTLEKSLDKTLYPNFSGNIWLLLLLVNLITTKNMDLTSLLLQELLKRPPIVPVPHLQRFPGQKLPETKQ